MPNNKIIEWKEKFEKLYYGAMFECGDYEQLLDDITSLLKQQAELTRKETLEEFGLEEPKGKIQFPPTVNKTTGIITHATVGGQLIELRKKHMAKIIEGEEPKGTIIITEE